MENSLLYYQWIKQINPKLANHPCINSNIFHTVSNWCSKLSGEKNKLYMKLFLKGKEMDVLLAK